MRELKLDFKRSQNGGYIAIKHGEKQSVFIKVEPETFVFNTFKELSAWLEKELGS